MYAFQSESTLYIGVNLKRLLTQNKRQIWSLNDCNGIRTHNHWLNDCAELWVLTGTVHLTVCSSHVSYTFQSESLLYIGVNMKELVTRIRHNVWILSECNASQTHNHLICKRNFNYFPKFFNLLSWIVSTYPYLAFDSVFLSCHVRVSEWIHTLCLPDCQETSECQGTN